MKTYSILRVLLITSTLLCSFALAESGHDHKSDRENHREVQNEHHGHNDDHEGESGEDDHSEEGFVEISNDSAQNAGITISEVQNKKFNQMLSFPGEIAVNGDKLVHVAPRFEGTIKKVLKQVGQVVTAGEILAVVKSNQSLATYNIMSETNGVVIEKDASAGEFVTSNKSIFTIANFDSVWVNVAINVNDLSSVKKGYNATVNSKSINLNQSGTISYIRPTLSEITRTALARIVLDNKERKWFPGMFVNVSIKLPSVEKTLVIPSSSVVFIDNKYKAFIKSKLPDGDTGFKAVDIEIGRDNTEETEVLKGLMEAQLVASGKTFILKAELGKGSAGHDH